MYQAKVLLILFRPINSNMILKKHKNKFKKSKGNTTNKRKDNKLQNKTRKFFNKFDFR